MISWSLGAANGIGEDLGPGNIGRFELSAPGLKEGSSMSKDELFHLTSQWIPLPSVPKDKETETVITGIPVTATLTLHEASPGSDLMLGVLAALAEAVDESQADISELIADDLLNRVTTPKTRTTHKTSRRGKWAWRGTPTEARRPAATDEASSAGRRLQVCGCCF